MCVVSGSLCSLPLPGWQQMSWRHSWTGNPVAANMSAVFSSCLKPRQRLRCVCVCSSTGQSPVWLFLHSKQPQPNYIHRMCQKLQRHQTGETAFHSLVPDSCIRRGHQRMVHCGHWFLVSSRVQCKFALLTHHCIHGSVPVHLKELITRQNSSHAVKTVTSSTRPGLRSGPGHWAFCSGSSPPVELPLRLTPSRKLRMAL